MAPIHSIDAKYNMKIIGQIFIYLKVFNDYHKYRISQQLRYGHIFYFNICVLAHQDAWNAFFAMKKQRQKVWLVLTVVQFTVKFLEPSKWRSYYYFQDKKVTFNGRGLMKKQFIAGILTANVMKNGNVDSGSSCV